jgi:hypothetical protein
MESAKKNLQLIDPGIEMRDPTALDVSKEALVNTGVDDHEKLEISKIVPQDTGDEQPRTGDTVSKTALINKLNYVNFKDGTLLLNFHHRKYDKTITRIAKPQPCMGDTLDCLWTETDNFHHLEHTYEFLNFLLVDGNKLLRVEPELIKMDGEGIRLALPERCYEISSRAATRHLSEGIRVQLLQNSSVFSNEHETLYTGECQIIRQTGGQQTRTYILEPLKQEIQRFRNKEYRSFRYELTPSPNIIFTHPFTNSIFNLKVIIPFFCRA